jgi:hypothetical protein
MAYKRKKKSGRKCIRRKRVRVKGQGMQWRCAKYGPKRRAKSSTKRRAKSSTKRRRKGTTRYSKRGARYYRPRVGKQSVQGPFTSSGHYYS